MILAANLSARAEAGRSAGDSAWARGLVAPFPLAWCGRLLERWEQRWPIDRAAANADHRDTVERIGRAHRAGVQADAGDAEICQAATDSARDMARRLDLIDQQARADLAGLDDERAGRLLLLGRYIDALHWLTMRGLADYLRAAARRSIAGALRRVVCERWWRRVLRRVHAVAVEGTARALGLVHKRAGCYVSNDGAARRQGQNVRNLAALESVHAINEQGQAYTLAELAAKGPANRAIRRHELMTRIAGFELIAKDCGHLAYFVTVTCPSRMHAWRSKPGSKHQTEPNPKHDGTTPDAAQAYLTKQWARFRAAADRAGLALYGFRIAEPNHDGTPHWHALLFFPPVASVSGRPANRVAVRLLRRYFLRNDSPDERGARKHRVAVERIDWTRGSAAGYVAKYVAKNIDGMHVEKDLYGNDALTSSQRVEAWAATWRVRQFQQIGGAPVGVWRELRRLHPEQASAAAGVALAIDACNAASVPPGVHTEQDAQQTAAHGWASYLELQGGARVRRRDQRLRVLFEQTGEIGRYGEPMEARPVGIVTDEKTIERRPALGIVPASSVARIIRAEVESERCIWTVCPLPKDEGMRAGVLAMVRQRMRGGVAPGAAGRPWSPVNNCTRPDLDSHPAPMFAAAVQRTPKRGRFFSWDRGRSTMRENEDGQQQQQQQNPGPGSGRPETASGAG